MTRMVVLPLADTDRFDAVVEAGVGEEEVEADFAGGTVAVFGDVEDDGAVATGGRAARLRHGRPARGV